MAARKAARPDAISREIRTSLTWGCISRRNIESTHDVIPMKRPHVLLALSCLVSLAAAEPIRLRVDFARPDGAWAMPALALGQGGLQSDPMIEPHIKELRQLRPRTIRLFLSEYYRIYPDHDRYD